MAQESLIGEAAVDEHAQGALGLARIEVESLPQRLDVLGSVERHAGGFGGRAVGLFVFLGGILARFGRRGDMGEVNGMVRVGPGASRGGRAAESCSTLWARTRLVWNFGPRDRDARRLRESWWPVLGSSESSMATHRGMSEGNCASRSRRMTVKAAAGSKRWWENRR